MDLKLTRQNDGRFDISRTGETQKNFDSAIIVSLFSNARADGLFGFWADAGLGSKIWTLSREKIITVTIDKAKLYCEQALAWMVSEGHAESITVDVTRPSMSELSIKVTIGSQEYRYMVGV